MLPLLPLIYYYNFDVQVGGKEQPPKSSDAFVDVEEQASPTESVTNSGQKMSESDEEEESPQGEPNEPEVLPLLYCVLPLLQLFVMTSSTTSTKPTHFDVQVGERKEQPPKPSIVNSRRTVSEVEEEKESLQVLHKSKDVARQQEVLPSILDATITTTTILLQLRRSGRGEGTAAKVLRCFRGRGGASEPNGKRHQLRTKDGRVGRGRGIPTGGTEGP